MTTSWILIGAALLFLESPSGMGETPRVQATPSGGSPEARPADSVEVYSANARGTVVEPGPGVRLSRLQSTHKPSPSGEGSSLPQGPVDCGQKEKHNIVEHKGQKPTPIPATGKALVYVIGPRGGIYQNKLAANGVWVAVLKRGQYTFFETNPGLLRLCFSPQSSIEDVLLLTAQAMRTYYLLLGVGIGRSFLMEIDESQAGELMKKSKYVTWKIRQ